MTELVDAENRLSDGATAAPENGADSVEPLDDVEMGITDLIAVDELVSSVYDERKLRNQEQNALSCAICLSDYGMSCVLVFSVMRHVLTNVCATVDGDIVVSGTSCSHLFHESCVFEWLAKKEHCPYCREAMATPSEIRTAAEDILGQERVNELWGTTNTIGLGHY